MKAIMINPETQTVEVIEFKGDFRDIQKAIDCRCFTTVSIDGPSMDSIFVDDEGLLASDGYVFDYLGHPIAGKGMILGCDSEGESISTGLSVVEVYRNINWRGYCEFEV